MLLLLRTLLALLLLPIQPQLLIPRPLLLSGIVDLIQSWLQPALSNGLDLRLIHELATADVQLALVLAARLGLLLGLLARLGGPLVHLGLRDLAGRLEDALVHVVHGLVHVALGGGEEGLAVGFFLFGVDIRDGGVEVRHLAAHAARALLVVGRVVVVVLGLFAGGPLARTSAHGEARAVGLSVVAVMLAVLHVLESLVDLGKAFLSQLLRGVLQVDVSQRLLLEIRL